MTDDSAKGGKKYPGGAGRLGATKQSASVGIKRGHSSSMDSGVKRKGRRGAWNDCERGNQRIERGALRSFKT